MECWDAGILGIKAEITYHYITPLLHYSNWGEALKFDVGDQ